jgi:hypothetical protein
LKTIKCYRFVKVDLTSENGAMSWQIGEWSKVEGALVCCATGLHAALTPRESIGHIYGQRWFIAEARGEIVKQDTKVAALEMRIIREIPEIVLQRFAIWCAIDCLGLYENHHPEDKRVSDCIQAAEDYLGDKIKVDELNKKREAAAAGGAAGAGGAAAGRAAAAAIAAAIAAAAPNSAAWANASASAAYAAHTAAAAYEAAVATVDAHASARNVATTAAAAAAADTAAARAHTAAAAGAVAHAAAVAAARGIAPVDSVSDAYYSSYAAYSAFPGDAYYAAQNRELSKMIDEHVADESL